MGFGLRPKAEAEGMKKIGLRPKAEAEGTKIENYNRLQAFTRKKKFENPTFIDLIRDSCKIVTWHGS